MKKLILFITMLIVLLGTATSFAEEKPQVAVLYVNNAKTTYDADVDNSILNNWFYNKCWGRTDILVCPTPFFIK